MLRLGLLALGIMPVACGVATPRATPFAAAHPSADALAASVLDAFARRDEAALRALALSEPEFREYVWPELPAARPERNLPFSYVWGELHQKSDGSLGGTLARIGGRRFTLVGVRFAGDVTPYPGYTVHRDTVLTVRDAAGATQELRLFGSVIEKDGAWKVFSYVVNS